MLKKYLNTALTLIVFLSGFLVEAQNGKRMVFDFKKQFCSYYGEKAPTTAIYTFASDNEAKQALTRIMQVTGLPTNFNIMAANVPNACAVIKCPTSSTCERYILYNQDFMLKVRDLTRTNWSEISILAHEIGHHLSGHTLDNLGSRPEIELEADKFSGFVLGKMGATLADAKAAMELIGSSSGSSTHPAKDARLAAIVNGWREATASNNTSSNTTSRTTTTSTTPIITKKSNVEINLQAEADRAAGNMASCCSQYGYKGTPEGQVIYDDRTYTSGDRANIHMIIKWTGVSGSNYRIEGVLTVDTSQGENYKSRSWSKIRDIEGMFVPGCSRGCIK